MDISIPNVLINEKFYNGVFKGYELIPEAGYVLHDSDSDVQNMTGITVHLYSGSGATCGKAYDFSAITLYVPDINGNTVAVTAYGDRKFFAFPTSLVPDPESNIYGGGLTTNQIKEEERHGS